VRRHRVLQVSFFRLLFVIPPCLLQIPRPPIVSLPPFVPSFQVCFVALVPSKEGAVVLSCDL